MRKKVSLAYITNDYERKASYKKRKKGVIKKVSELSTLCGVEACAIIYHNQYDPEPEVWPSKEQAHATLTRFRNLSEMDQGRKMVNQESFIRQRIKKAKDQLFRLQREHKCRKLECYMYQCITCITSTRTFDETLFSDGTIFSDAAEMKWVINQTLRNIKARKDALMAESYRRQLALLPPPSGATPLPLPLLPPPLPPVSPLPTDVLVPPMEEDNLDGFPWNMVKSLTNGLSHTDGLEDGDFGWDVGTAKPHQNIFNPSTSDQQGNQENDFNNSKNSNDPNNFNYFNN